MSDSHAVATQSFQISLAACQRSSVQVVTGEFSASTHHPFPTTVEWGLVWLEEPSMRVTKEAFCDGDTGSHLHEHTYFITATASIFVCTHTCVYEP